jgi:hypothetical protein
MPNDVQRITKTLVARTTQSFGLAFSGSTLAATGAYALSRRGHHAYLGQFLSQEVQAEVGGYIRLGVATRRGFDLWPAMDASSGVAKISFVERDVETTFQVRSYRVGFQARRID